MKLYRKDIAKIAGVSAQTVSYVLNGSRNFSQETVDKVMDAVQRTGYKPDAIAKGLAKKHLNIVAILLSTTFPIQCTAKSWMVFSKRLIKVATLLSWRI